MNSVMVEDKYDYAFMRMMRGAFVNACGVHISWLFTNLEFVNVQFVAV